MFMPAPCITNALVMYPSPTDDDFQAYLRTKASTRFAWAHPGCPVQLSIALALTSSNLQLNPRARVQLLSGNPVEVPEPYLTAPRPDGYTHLGHRKRLWGPGNSLWEAWLQSVATSQNLLWLVGPTGHCIGSVFSGWGRQLDVHRAGEAHDRGV